MKKILTLLCIFLMLSRLGSAQSTTFVSGVIDGGQGGGHIRLYPAAIPVVVPLGSGHKATPSGVSSLHTDEVGASAFPNPAAGRLNLHHLSPTSGRLQIDITDLTGRRVYNADYDTNGEFATQINTASYQAGSYLVTFSFVSSTGTRQPPVTRKIQVLNSL